jgi:hypothetical protein
MAAPQSYIDRTVAELKDLHAQGTISAEYLGEQIAILNDPDDPLGGGYGMVLPVDTTPIEPGVREVSTVWLTRKQLQENDLGWVLAEIRKQCEKIVSRTPPRADYPEQFKQVEAKATDIWRKLNGLARQQTR